jgi:hypothetical protein
VTSQININKEIRKCKFGLIGHRFRKDDSEPCKAALQWNAQGTRHKRKRKAKKFVATNYTERMWEAQLE